MQITLTFEPTPQNLKDLRAFIDELEKINAEDAPAPVIEKSVTVTAEPRENLAKPIDEPPKITAQDVKAICLKLSKAGKQAELKAAFAKFGGKKLSDIAESDFGALLEELGNA